MVFIPIARYTSSQAGRTLKRVECESCDTEYFYYMKRTITASASSPGFASRGAALQAQGEAADLLRHLLINDVDPVPCPKCGTYQAQMVDALREQTYHPLLVWSRIGGIACAVLVVVTGFFLIASEGRDIGVGMFFAGLAALSGLIAGILYWFHSIFVQQLHPNDLPLKERLEQASRRAVSRTQLEQEREPLFDQTLMRERLHQLIQPALRYWQPPQNMLDQPEVARRHVRQFIAQMVASEPLPLASQEKEQLIDALLTQEFPTLGRPTPPEQLAPSADTDQSIRSATSEHFRGREQP